MIDRALGVAGIGVSLLSGLLFFVFPKLNRIVGIAGLVLGTLLIVAAAGIALLPDSTKQDYPHIFENVEAWSVSFKIGGLLAGGPLDFDKNISSYVIGLPECRFYNLSTTQRRIIDLRLTIPTKDPNDLLGPSITLTTQTLEFGFKRAQTPGIVDLPIVLEPSSSVEGRVDFLVPEDIKDRIRQDDFKWLKYGEATVDVTEHRSGKTIKIQVGESYDAATALISKP